MTMRRRAVPTRGPDSDRPLQRRVSSVQASRRHVSCSRSEISPGATKIAASGRERWLPTCGRFGGGGGSLNGALQGGILISTRHIPAITSY